MARLKFNKYGLAEDPTGADVKWTVGGREYLVRVTGFYRRENGPAMLTTRYFCGNIGPNVAASVVEVLERDYENAE